MNADQLRADFQPFSDIGESAVKVSDVVDRFEVRFKREGRQLKLSIDKTTGKVECRIGTGPQRRFSDLATLLASDFLSNLKKWADTQRELLRGELPSVAHLLPFHGRTHDGSELQSIEEVDALLGREGRPPAATEVLLIDGPAGIGKTNLIEQLALGRAANYRGSGKPLILHVKSRGRVLSNLQDLMAFSLQTIRSQITYDQIPILVKYGLVIIAVDGFDELSDPNGYELAWAQLGELVNFIRGKGTLILAGRDTFMGRDRLLKDVPALREGRDIVTSLTVNPPRPEQAKQWLKQNGWQESNFAIPSISVLLEEESFALRPVFLRMLAAHIKPKDLANKHERYLTPFLVGRMTSREANLFGAPVHAVMSQADRERFLERFLREVARAMADQQTESLEASEIAWISEMVLSDDLAPEVRALIKHRASNVAFFVNDERPGYRAFMHSYLLNYFVAIESIALIASEEIPKYIRRNLLGPEFLSVFSDVAAEAAVKERDVFSQFWKNVSGMPFSYTNLDRGLRNIGALALGAMPAVDEMTSGSLQEFECDDVVIRGLCPSFALDKIEISQLDCRGSDLSSVSWTNGRVGHVIADNSIKVSHSFPLPKKITVMEGGVPSSPEDLAAWLGARGRDPSAVQGVGLASPELRARAIYKLLNRAARMRQYWLRADEDDAQASKIIHDPEWPKLSGLLTAHDFLRMESRQASGRASVFFHIKHRERILAERSDDSELKSLFEDMAKL